MINFIFAATVAATCAADTIKLPPPDRDSGVTVMQALNLGDNIILHLNHPIGWPKQ